MDIITIYGHAGVADAPRGERVVHVGMEDSDGPRPDETVELTAWPGEAGSYAVRTRRGGALAAWVAPGPHL